MAHPAQQPLRRSGSVERPLGIDMTEGVERTVVGGDAVENRRGRLDRRNAALLVTLQQLDRREPSEFFRHRCRHQRIPTMVLFPPCGSEWQHIKPLCNVTLPHCSERKPPGPSRSARRKCRRARLANRHPRRTGCHPLFLGRRLLRRGTRGHPPGERRLCRQCDAYRFRPWRPDLPVGTVAAADLGDLAYDEGDPAQNRDRIRDTIATILDRGAVPVVIGGDDSGADTDVSSLAGRGPLTLLQIDAHIDWRDEVMGERLDLSSTMRRASRWGKSSGSSRWASAASARHGSAISRMRGATTASCRRRWWMAAGRTRSSDSCRWASR